MGHYYRQYLDATLSSRTPIAVIKLIEVLVSQSTTDWEDRDEEYENSVLSLFPKFNQNPLFDYGLIYESGVSSLTKKDSGEYHIWVTSSCKDDDDFRQFIDIIKPYVLLSGGCYTNYDYSESNINISLK